MKILAELVALGRASTLALPLAAAVAGLCSAEELTFHLAVEDGKTIGGAVTLRAVEGDDIVVVLESDDALELHLHGYDISAHLVPDEAVALEFRADLVGRFPAETHGHGDGHHETLFYLEVHPQ